MKKIAALVLALVLALSLSATAFAVIPLWNDIGGGKSDAYEANFNTKIESALEMVFHAAKAPKYDKNGKCATPGNIAYYEVGTATDSILTKGDKYVQVSSIPADADASEYILVKKCDASIAVGEKLVGSQSASNGVYILKKAGAVGYAYTATAFSAWSDKCEGYADPDDDKDYYECDKLATAAGNKIAAEDDAVDTASPTNNVLVGGVVVTLATPTQVTPTAHNWLATKFNDKGAATEYTCTECKTVGTVINSPVNAPAGYKIDKLGETLIAYKSVAPGAATSTSTKTDIESAKTFDAGIAMYVGMSLMAVTGSAVVIGKKKEF